MIRVTRLQANFVWLVLSLPNPFLAIVKHSSSNLKDQATVSSEIAKIA